MAENDDHIDPSEIEAMLNSAGGEGADSPAEEDSSSDEDLSTSNSESDSSMGDLLDASDIDALLAEASGGSGTGSVPGGMNSTSSSKPQPNHATEELLNEAEANLAAAISADFGNHPGQKKDVSGATSLPLQDLNRVLGNSQRGELNLLQDVELDLRIELGRAELQIEEVVSLKSGSVVPLDKLAGDPVDILVNGRLIARGEVLVLNDNFCVRVAEILTPQK
ncbi:flagellar motor switch protein FliN [uncultured Rubinisphaera sp.]|uniref:flagellar motor switch protein FliN n=1 Tax=uncultured Rubinisphaera sp. TaxID=1678686 RepID=UPI00267EC1D4